MKIACDIDGCLADFNSAYIPLIIKITGRDLFPEDWKKTLDKTYPITWNYEAQAGYQGFEISRVWKEIKADPKFWQNLKPYPDARETLAELNRLSREGDEVYFLTNRMGYKVKYQTENWLYQNGMNFPTVILGADKAPIINHLGINFFIDDKLETVNDIAKIAQMHTDFPLTGGVYLKDMPYNREGRRSDLRVVSSVKEALQTEGVWKEQAKKYMNRGQQRVGDQVV